jgi:hypothetical protein
MRCALRILLLLLTTLAFAPAAVHAGTTAPVRAEIEFRITIPHVLRLTMAGQPAAIEVTQDDIERGEVVVRVPRVMLVANGRHGFRLRTELHHAAFTGVAMHGLARPVEAHQRVGLTWMPRTDVRPQPAEVEMRFRLAAGTLPGRYSWPLQLTLEDA